MARKDDIIDTGFPGIKQKKSNGKYIVTLDLGRQRVPDKKTGQMKLKQVKTTRTVDTLREARAIIGENNAEKARRKQTGVTSKMTFELAFQDFMDYKKPDWDATNLERNKSYQKRLNAYFGDMEVKKIDVLEIEKFFRWCQQEQGEFGPLQNITIGSYKSILSKFFKFMSKRTSLYGELGNPVKNAEVGEVELFEATTLTAEQVNDIFRYMLDNEHDTAIIVGWSLACFTGMRRGEIAGLRWGDIDWENKKIHILRQRKRVSKTHYDKGWIESVPKKGKENAKTPEGRKERWTAFPDPLAFVLTAAKRQQEVYSRREVTDDDYVYRQKADLVNDVICSPDAITKRNNDMQNRYNKKRKEAEKEELEHYRLHDLRHTHASLCLNGGVLPFQVYYSMGHSFNKHTDPTTLKVYLHDDGDRSQINDFISELITTPLEIFDFEDDLLTPKQRNSKRINLRNDEV